MERNYVYEDIELDNGWTAMIEVRAHADRMIVADFMACSPKSDRVVTECDTSFRNGQPLTDALEVRKSCERWLASVMESHGIPEHHAQYRAKLRARRMMIRDVEAAPASFDAAIMGQTAEMIRKCVQPHFVNPHPYRTGVLGEGTNSDSLDADWVDQC